MKKLNVAVLGLGTMGKVHAEAWTRIPNAELVGVSALDREKTERLAKQYGAEAYADLTELLDQEEIDVVDICLPTYLHEEYVTKVAQAGKHVICEKPLGLHKDQAENIIKVCEENNVQLFVAQVVRFFPEYAQAHHEVKSGKVGRPGVVRLTRGGPFPRAWHNWYADESKSGGMILDLMIHDFDWLRWTFGEVKRVMARRVLQENNSDSLQYALVTLRMTDGTIAHVEGSWMHTSFRTTYEITGDKGMISYDSREAAPLVVSVRDNDSSSGSGGVAVPESPLSKGPYERELEHFADCLLTGKAPIVTPYDAMKAVEISRAAIKSANLGEPVELVDEEKVIK